MPRSKKTSKRKGRKEKPTMKSKLAELHPISVEDSILQAEAAINTFNYESAIENCQKALVMDSKNIKVLELLAGVLMETQDFEKAESLYLQCIEICPDEGYSKYFSLAQISYSQKALEFYEKGISLLERTLENQENKQPEACAKSDSPPLNRILSDAFSSIAELYTTDLCDEENAEALCESYLQKSIQADDQNPEAYQGLANLRLIQGNDEEAKNLMTKSLSFWLPQSLEDDRDIEIELTIPEYDNRIHTSQLLIELGMFEESNQVLEQLLNENNKIFTVWYLLAWSNYIQGEIYHKNAFFYLKKAKETAKKNGCDDEDKLNHVEELLAELNEKIISDDENEPEDATEEFDIASSDDDSEAEMDV